VILTVAGVAGVPLGVAAGHWAWAAFATSLGAVPVTVVPVPALLAGFGVLLAAGNLLAAGPGAVAARTPPAAVLRAEWPPRASRGRRPRPRPGERASWPRKTGSCARTVQGREPWAGDSPGPPFSARHDGHSPQKVTSARSITKPALARGSRQGV
jgi:hypothetical protein